MEEWQKAVITKNLPYLIENIDCNVVFLSHLRSNGVISKIDEAAIECCASLGNLSKAKKLLDILETRESGYRTLAIALFETKQTGALFKLLEGAENNFPDQSPFLICGISIDCDEVLSKVVLFEGAKVNLNELCNPINSDKVEAIINDCMDVETYKKLIYNVERSVLSLVSNTVPDPISYYIPRTITLKSTLDPSIFRRLETDVFLIEGIQPHQLTVLANRRLEDFDGTTHKQPADSINPAQPKSSMYTAMRELMWQKTTPLKLEVETDKSSNQIHCLTVRFILLEKQNHFDRIVALSESPVHWIKYENETYVYVKSNQNGGTSRVQEFLRESTDKLFSEDEFLDMCLRGPTCHAYLIYETSGMGKTVLLAAFAGKVKGRSQGNTIFISASKLVSINEKDKELNVIVFRERLARFITNNKLGAKLQEELFSNIEHSIHLFIDGFDEIPKIDVKHAQNIITFILNNIKNIRLYITTRPHYKTELEDLFGVSGYNILPFGENHQIRFFTSYWNNEHNIQTTPVVAEFAKKCIQTFNSTVSVEDRSLAGIPLQCKMLAELYLDDARDETPTLNKKYLINSVYKMYKRYIDSRFEAYKNEAERNLLYHFHVVSAILLIFPGKLNITCPAFTNEIYRIGIMENNSSLPNKAVFVHRSFAEFLAAEAILVWCQFKPPNEIDPKTLTRFLLDNVFQTQSTFEIGPVMAKRFYHITVTRFFEIGLSENSIYRQNLVNIIKPQDASDIYNSETLLDLLKASVDSDSVTLFTLFLDLNLFLQRDMKQKIAEFFSTAIFRKHSTPDGTWQEIYKDSFQNKLGVEYLVSISSKLCSVNLMKHVCDFLYKTSGKHFHNYEYSRKNSPVYLALQRGEYQVVEYLLVQSSPDYFSAFHPLNAILNESYFDNVAVIERKLQIIELLLTNYPEHFDVNGELWLEKEYIPPPLLSERSHLTLLKCLIQKGANVLVKHREDFDRNVGHRICWYFSPQDYHDFVEFILNFDFNQAKYLFEMCDSSDSKGTPILYAVYFIEVQWSTLNLLQLHNIRLDVVNSKKETLLYYAAWGKRSISFLKFVIRKQFCPLELKNDRGNTFLHELPVYYSDSDYNAILEYLVQIERTDIFNVTNNNMCLPIHIAVMSHDIGEKTLNLFKSNSVEFNAIDLGGNSILMCAAWARKNLPTLKTLVSFGLDIMAQNNEGLNLGHIVAEKYGAKEFHQFVEYIISLSNDKFQPKQMFEVKDKSKVEFTPIHRAVAKIELRFATFELLEVNNVKLDVVTSWHKTLLHAAVEGKRSVSFLKYIIQKKYCPLETQDTLGNTFLHYLSEYYSECDYIEVLEYITEIGRTDIFHIKNNNQHLPIHFAVIDYEINEKTLDLFQSNFVDFSCTDDNGTSILMHAAISKTSLSTLKTLVSFGLDIMAQDNDGWNLGHIVAEICSADEFHQFVEYILSLSNDEFQPKQMFETKDKSKFDCTPIHRAVLKIELHFATFELLEVNNVKLDVVTSRYHTILHYAVGGKRSVSFLKYIIQKKYCALETQSALGNTFLHNLSHYYRESDYCEILEYLIGIGRTDIFHIKNHESYLPIHNAVLEYEISEKTLTLFQSNSVDLSSIDKYGNSILMCAARSGKSLSTLKTLVSFGLDILTQNNNGWNLGHIVAAKYSAEEFHQFVEYILSLSNDEFQPKQMFEIKDKSEFDCTPIHRAVANIELHFATFELLELHNVKLDIVNAKQQTILHYAVEGKRSVSFLKYIIQKKYCPLETQADTYGNTFLHNLSHYYRESDYCEILEYLIGIGRTDIFHIKNYESYLPIHNAVLEYEISEKTLTLFQSNSVDLSSIDKYGNSILMCAARSGKSLSTLKTLVSFGLDILTQNNNGRNLGHIIAEKYSADEFHQFVQFILSLSNDKFQSQQMFEIKGKTEFANTPIHIAVFHSELHFATFELLELHNVKLDVVTSQHHTILHAAVAGKRSVSFLKYIIQKKYCPLETQEDTCGNTFLHALSYYYSESEYCEVLEYLTKIRRTDIFHIKNHDSFHPHPFLVAYYEVGEKTLNLLKLNSVDLNATCNSRCSVLFYAIRNQRSLNFVKKLVSLGADWKYRDIHNTTALLLAAECGLLDHVKYFIELGLDIHEMDNDGDNALHCAVVSKHEGIAEKVSFLILKGANVLHKNKQAKTPYMVAQEKNIEDQSILESLQATND